MNRDQRHQDAAGDRRGRRGTSMPAFGSASPAHRVLADGEIGAIVSFMRTWEEGR